MAELHETLAVEKDLRGQAARVMQETKHVFAKGELFRGSITSYKPFADEDAHLSEEKHEAIGSDVMARLRFTAEHVGKFWDAVLQKEKTNQTAVADIVLEDGTVLATAVPATMCLGLEGKLVEFRDAIKGMPTLDAKTEWVQAEGQPEGIFRMAHDAFTFRGKKVEEPVVLYEATPEHPAQVQVHTRDVNVGKVTKRVFSSAVTSARAATILGRVEDMIRATRLARQRANKATVVTDKIASNLMNHILGD